jgi:hypothetical protein
LTLCAAFDHLNDEEWKNNIFNRAYQQKFISKNWKHNLEEFLMSLDESGIA